MTPFNPASRCPKCGGRDVAAHWREGHSCSRGLSCFEPERIERHCRTCRFEWDEAPLDGASSGQSPTEGDTP